MFDRAYVFACGSHYHGWSGMCLEPTADRCLLKGRRLDLSDQYAKDFELTCVGKRHSVTRSQNSTKPTETASNR